jgi:hypothetical protein
LDVARKRSEAVDRHRLAEERSLEAHRRVAERVRRDPTLISAARATLRRWVDAGTVAPVYERLWTEALDGPLEALLALLVAETDHARAMRQVSPFAGLLPPRERWSLWREVAERVAREEADTR